MLTLIPVGGVGTVTSAVRLAEPLTDKAHWIVVDPAPMAVAKPAVTLATEELVEVHRP